jgi:hypothetical protein
MPVSVCLTKLIYVALEHLNMGQGFSFERLCCETMFSAMTSACYIVVCGGIDISSR